MNATDLISLLSSTRVRANRNLPIHAPKFTYPLPATPKILQILGRVLNGFIRLSVEMSKREAKTQEAKTTAASVGHKRRPNFTLELEVLLD